MSFVSEFQPIGGADFSPVVKEKSSAFAKGQDKLHKGEEQEWCVTFAERKGGTRVIRLLIS